MILFIGSYSSWPASDDFSTPRILNALMKLLSLKNFTLLILKIEETFKLQKKILCHFRKFIQTNKFVQKYVQLIHSDSLAAIAYLQS